MAIPYYIFAILYVIGVLVCVGFFLINFYHLKHFGFFDFAGQVQTVMVVAIFLIILMFTVLFVLHIDWTDTAELFGNLSVDVIT